jgi:pSer/pThr/pTyr-binding forkhead associated (FHA) protein
VSLTVSYQGTDFTVEEDTSAFIGSGEAATIRIVRPGISRRHAVVSYDGTTWKFEDAGSRNGSFADGDRIHVITIDDQISLCLGHPSDGELVTLTPEGAEPVATPDEDIQDEIDAFVLPETPPATPARTSRPVPAASSAPPTVTESTELAEAIREQISAIKGLTWSVWGMIAVTAALAVMTLFVGILGT